MRSNEIEAYKQSLKLSDLQRKILIGTLLGDGHLETQSNGRIYRLKIEHSYLQKEYVDWLYHIFKEWVLTPPREKSQVVQGILYKKYCFSTVSHGAFRFYAQQFYDGKRKVLPKLIKKWLSPLVMAIWYMDDGSIKSDRHRALIINTQSFTTLEVIKLRDVINEKYGIFMKLRKQIRKTSDRYQLITVGNSVERFVEIIKPYILPSMRYKLGKLGNKIA